MSPGWTPFRPSTSAGGFHTVCPYFTVRRSWITGSQNPASTRMHSSAVLMTPKQYGMRRKPSFGCAANRLLAGNRSTYPYSTSQTECADITSLQICLGRSPLGLRVLVDGTQLFGQDGRSDGSGVHAEQAGELEDFHDFLSRRADPDRVPHVQLQAWCVQVRR